MLGNMFFTFFRIAELLTLIPVIGMLSYFVNIFVTNNQLTPDYVLVLFIVSTLAGAWALVTLFKQGSVRRNGHFVALIDLCFAGALIAGVYYLRDVTNTDCVHFTGGVTTSGNPFTVGNNYVSIQPWTINYTPWGVDANKTCTMLKASFALGIMNILFFLVTSLVALNMRRRERDIVEKTYTRRSSHGSRRGHHRRSSSHSSRRNYYV